MNEMLSVLRRDERALYNLRALYKRFGYSGYKVGKFEEYDLYAHNKSFLVSEQVLTFTDTDGKLMALKPDVTLSIAKNIPVNETGLQKLYYNENVYRTSAESRGFREIMQTGLECVGAIDALAQNEVIMLALESLALISDRYVLDLSHMGLIEGLFDSAEVELSLRDEIAGFVRAKNLTALEGLCAGGTISDAFCQTLITLTDLYLPLGEALKMIEKHLYNDKMTAAYNELVAIADAMKLYGVDENLYFDFSLMNDRSYYDGILCKGFVSGVPDSVLSGGRYDRLLQKMGKAGGAIGFAVYLDRLEPDETALDVDVQLVYDNTVSMQTVIEAVKTLTGEGKSVKTVRTVDQTLRSRERLQITQGGLVSLE